MRSACTRSCTAQPHAASLRSMFFRASVSGFPLMCLEFRNWCVYVRHFRPAAKHKISADSVTEDNRNDAAWSSRSNTDPYLHKVLRICHIDGGLQRGGLLVRIVKTAETNRINMTKQSRCYPPPEKPRARNTTPTIPTSMLAYQIGRREVRAAIADKAIAICVKVTQ